MIALSKAPFYSGTSNIVVPLKQADYPQEWKGASRLTYYASLFSSVEINATFYRMPRAATVAGWKESVPDDFRFTFKVPKTITHVKDLRFSVEEVERFVETVGSIGHKKGCLLVQLPPKASRDLDAELEGLLESLSSEAEGWKIAVEFRHPSWYVSRTYRMLQQYGAGMVVQDKGAAPTPEIDVAEQFAYLRMHGPDGNYRGTYEDDVLQRQADRIARWRSEGREVYVYFNNTMGAALDNLQTLNRMIQGH